MKIVYKILVYCLLPLMSAVIVWRIYEGVQEPVRLKEELQVRERMAAARLADIRTLNVEYSHMHDGLYAPCLDSLKSFYENGQLETDFLFGEKDDSLTIAVTKDYTAKFKKSYKPAKTKKKLSKEESAAAYQLALNNYLYELYKKNDPKIKVSGSIPQFEPVKNVLFVNREDFSIDEIFLVPKSDVRIDYQALEKVVTSAGVETPVFEASIPYEKLMHGMKEQFIVNTIDDCYQMEQGERIQKFYPGVKVGDLTGREGNRGTWE